MGSQPTITPPRSNGEGLCLEVARMFPVLVECPGALCQLPVSQPASLWMLIELGVGCWVVLNLLSGP